MELDVNGTIVADPTAADIVRALDAPSFSDDWYIALESESGASLDALAEEGGTFTLSFGDDKRRRRVEVDAATVKAVYVKFLAGDASWQNEVGGHGDPSKQEFVSDTRPVLGRSGDQPPLAAMIVMVAIIGLVALIYAIERASPGAIRGNVPFGRSDYFWIGLIFLPMVALVLVATVTKLIEFRQSQSWAQTTGHIVRSEIEVRRHQFQGEPETVKNVPAVEYEFKVGARTIHGVRIGIGDDTGGANTEATLKRYPMGANVTVYYDPADPRQCVLEREGPKGVTKRDAASGLAGGLALLALFGGAIYWLIAIGPDFVRVHFPKAADKPAFPLVAAGFGLVLLLFFVGSRRNSKQAANWPSVRGKIVRSKVEEYQERDSDGRLRTNYRPAVEFSYPVHGRDYHGNQIKVGLTVSAGKAYAEKVIAKYPAGSEIEVHYDPNDPSTAALENPTGMTWVVAVAALGCFALASWQLGIFG